MKNEVQIFMLLIPKCLTQIGVGTGSLKNRTETQFVGYPPPLPYYIFDFLFNIEHINIFWKVLYGILERSCNAFWKGVINTFLLSRNNAFPLRYYA